LIFISFFKELISRKLILLKGLTKFFLLYMKLMLIRGFFNNYKLDLIILYLFLMIKISRLLSLSNYTVKMYRNYI